MTRRLLVAVFGLCLFLATTVIFAAENHIAAAISNASTAVELGKQNNSELLVVQAQAALAHAQAGQMAAANPHTQEAIKDLELAISEGKQGLAEEATFHAQAALNHLVQAQ